MAIELLTPARARAVDPVITTRMLGYSAADDFSFAHLCPHVPVGVRAGVIVEHGAEEYREMNLARLPGETRRRMRFGRGTRKYAIVQNALDGILAVETGEESRAIGIDEQMRVAVGTYKTALRQKEIAAAKLFTASGTYSAGNHKTLSGSSQWSHASSKPAKAVEDGKEVVAGKIGRDPNTLVVSTSVHRALRNNADVLDRIKYTGSRDGSPVTEAVLAEYFDVENYRIARSRKGEIGDFDLIWGDNAILAYVAMGEEITANSPSFGFTYRLRGYPIARTPWFDQTNDSWIFPVTVEEETVIALKDAGYLFMDVTA